MADDRNYYQILGVDPKISQKDLKIHFRKIIKRYHPDLHAGEGFEDLYRIILEAYDVLSNPAKRFDYDHTFGFGSTSPLYGTGHSYSDYGMAPETRAGTTRPQGAAKQTPPPPRTTNVGPEDPYEVFRRIRDTQKKVVKNNYSLQDYLLREKTLGILVLSCVLIAGLSTLTGASLFSTTGAQLAGVATTSAILVLASWIIYFLVRAFIMESKNKPVRAFFWIYALLWGVIYSYFMRSLRDDYGDSTLQFIFSIVLFWVIFAYSTFSLEMDRQSEQQKRR
ncbi:MAG: DnaJ domain-containing protein [Synergistaceae bacterium]|jgi:hypothetical protein|nr:DnaJ domain-containing protein [Synergistaceae bacterium]